MKRIAKNDLQSLISDTLQKLTGSSETFSAFILTASENHKYPFLDQLMIYAQRPDATACASIPIWNRLGRWIKPSAKAIALNPLPDSSEVRFVFDVADTSSVRGNDGKIDRWQMNEDYSQSVIRELSDRYGDAAARTVKDALLFASGVAADTRSDTEPDDLRRWAEGSAFAALDEAAQAEVYARLLNNGVLSMTLHRCGYDKGSNVPDAFRDIEYFNTQGAMIFLGNQISARAKDILSVVEKSIREEIKKQENLNKTTGSVYDADNSIRIQAEKEVSNGTELQEGRGLLHPGSGGERAEAGALGKNEMGVSRTDGSDELQSDAAQRDAVPPSAGDRTAGERNDGSADQGYGVGAGRDGASEGSGSDEVGWPDEQYPERSGGDREGGADFPLTDDDAEEEDDYGYDESPYDEDEEPDVSFPTAAEQISNIVEAEAETVSAFAISQEDIDAVLLHGSNVSRGKLRIYAQYQKHESAADNISMLKDEYGIGGAYPAASSRGRALDENHDGKGIQIGIGAVGRPDTRVLLSWAKVEKRIGELIAAGRYLNDKEAEEYPKFMRERLLRSQRNAIAADFRMLVRDFNDLQVANGDPLLNTYVLSNCASEFVVGQKTTWTLKEENYILPLMRDAVATILSGDLRFHDRALALQAQLSSDLAAPLEPTYDELNPPPPPRREYRFDAGDIVYIGTQEYDIVLLDAETAVLYDPEFPLYNREMPREEFDAKIKDNPLNDKYLFVVEEPSIEPADTALEETQQQKDAQALFEQQVDAVLSGEAMDDSQLVLGNTPALLGKYGFNTSLPLVVRSKKIREINDEPRDTGPNRHGLAAEIIKSFPNAVANPAIVLISRTRPQDSIVLVSDMEDQNHQPVILAIQANRTANINQVSITANSLNSAYGRHKFNEFLQKSFDENLVLTVGEKDSHLILQSPWLQLPNGLKSGDYADNIARFYSAVNHYNPEPQQKRDYRITYDGIGSGHPSERYEANILAIKTLKHLEESGALANDQQQETLARYVGWGGLSDCFDERNPKCAELKALLTPEEYAAARESTLTAFYTPPVVIRSMYQVLDNLGFKKGNILEPGCGIGSFMGMLPAQMNAKFYGVELDQISGRIAQQLYQTANINVQGYETTDLPDSFFDVAIGNVPFGNFKVSDRRYDKHGFLIHDYYFAKTLDKVRPGGIIAFITSKGTMDKSSPVVRKYIAQRAELLGAIRLPSNTFTAAAGAKVTSDILFFQKRDRPIENEPDWLNLSADDRGIVMNQYFCDHPEMVIGEMKEVSGPFGKDTACIARPDDNFAALLQAAASKITGDIWEYDHAEQQSDGEERSIPADPTVRNFSYTLVDGKLYFRENSRMNPVETSASSAQRIKGLIALRDCTRTLIEYQTLDYPDAEIRAAQEKLTAEYDRFTAKFGRICSRGNSMAFGDDASYFLLSSLEINDDEGNFERKADIFTKRTIKQHTSIVSADNAHEALVASMNELGCVSMEYMQQLTGKTEEELFQELHGVIYRNPLHTRDGDREQKYIPADEYLSGNVREKLAQAKLSAAMFPEYRENTAALEAVLPEDLGPAEITVRLGAAWVPTDIIDDFMTDLIEPSGWSRNSIHAKYNSYTGEWSVEGKNYGQWNVKANTTYGTKRANAYRIIEDTLNLRDIRIYDYVQDENGNKRPVLNKKETAIAQGKQESIKQEFQNWIWTDPSRRERICTLYNEKFNSFRPREYDGSHLTFPGMNPEITLRQHQVNAVARGLYGHNVLLAHVVGAGKTYTMAAIAQESKRIGLCHKSLFVVPNHLTEQWAAEYLRLYPAANILVAKRKDFETKNRKRFCSRIATGDYDAVIIGHSQFEKIPLSAERQRMTLEKQQDEIIQGIEEAKQQRGERLTVKQLERALKSVRTKLDRLNDQSSKDDVVTFEELGVDRLFVDEAHYFKNLAAFSKMRNVAGISQAEAKKSSDLYMKCRYLDEITGSRGIVFATGTPISNTMVEMYTMQKYLQYDLLSKNNLVNFDSWASVFGETVTSMELAPEGTGYRIKTRFAKFFNLPELMATFKESADIQTADMLNLPVPKVIRDNIVLPPSEEQKAMVAQLADRAEKVRDGLVNSSQDNMLCITNDGRKLALDQRLVNELLPENENGKVSVCADNVFSVWQETVAKRSTQMVFCDLSTPHEDGRFNVYDALRDKLIAKGIPAEEIAYIHSAKTETQKRDLFGKVRSGQVRVIIGSTEKMGAGTNVQQKMIALHHLECPWRPSDLQQRDGRIIRQGNENPEVRIFTYVTEGTFDSYLYQLVENKQRFIGQIMTSKSPVRSAEDVDEQALSYAEIKALCSGNPMIKEKMDLDVDVSRLTLLKAAHLNQRYALEDAIAKRYPAEIRSLQQRIDDYRRDISRLEKYDLDADGFSPMAVEGVTYTEKKAAGSALIEAIRNVPARTTAHLGSYRGFDLYYRNDIIDTSCLILQGAGTHDVTVSRDFIGNITRINNVMASFEKRLAETQVKLEDTELQLANAKLEVHKPFERETELAEKQKRLEELNVLLNIDKAESEIVDDPDEETAEEPETGDKPERDEEENFRQAATQAYRAMPHRSRSEDLEL